VPRAASPATLAGSTRLPSLPAAPKRGSEGPDPLVRGLETSRESARTATLCRGSSAWSSYPRDPIPRWLSIVSLGASFIPGGKIAVRGWAALGAMAPIGAKSFSSEKRALVEMAKRDKRTGMTGGDMQAYKDLNKALPDPFRSNQVHGPEAHPLRTPNSPPGPGQTLHGHVGPVNYIPIKGG